jgi:hypothetical protein
VKARSKASERAINKIKRFFINPPCVKNEIPYVTIVSLENVKINPYSVKIQKYLFSSIQNIQKLFGKNIHLA